MNRKYFFVILILSISFSFFAIQSLKAEEEEGLYFTYAGPVFGTGFNRVVYRDWSYESNTRKSQELTGYSLSGGGLFNIYVEKFIGEFSIEYMGDFSSEESASIQHMLYTSAGKFSYPLPANNNFLLTAGLGVYLETSPSSKDFNGGGGLNCLLGGVYVLNREIRLVGDILFRYGNYGIGDDSNKLSLGIKIGAIYKVGRI